MPDSPIRTIRGVGGPNSLKMVSLSVSPAPNPADGYVCEGLQGAITGTGRTPELALEAAQRAQQAYLVNDKTAGRGFRQVTAAEMGISE